MGKLDGKVAFITGAARGQGRSHAVRLAEEGADIIALDLCAQIEEVEYPMSTPEDLALTVKMVEAEGRRIVAHQADVRDLPAVQGVLSDGVAELGRVDIVLANAGIMATTNELAERQSAWHASIDVMLTGVLHTIQAAVPQMVEQAQGGSIVITSSTAGLKGGTTELGLATPGLLGYHAAKHGVAGLMRCYARALAPHRIRVNSVHPSGVDSPMIHNDAFTTWVTKWPDFGDAFSNAIPIRTLECIDISNAIAWLCSDEARYVTGVQLPVDAGSAIK